MIAPNFIKHPEALRFQRELFSNGYHNSPRIMRLVQCIFDWTPTAPDWWKEAKGRARDLARRVKKSINDFFKDMAVKASDQLRLVFEAPHVPSTLNEELEARIVAAGGRDNYARPDLAGYTLSDIGRYRSYCHIGRNKFLGPFEYSFTYSPEGEFPSTATPELHALDDMTPTINGKLFEAKVHTLDALADLAPDEVMEITGLTEESACNLLRQARAHWFQS